MCHHACLQRMDHHFRDKLIWNKHVAKLHKDGPREFHVGHRMNHPAFTKFVKSSNLSLQKFPNILLVSRVTCLWKLLCAAQFTDWLVEIGLWQVFITAATAAFKQSMSAKLLLLSSLGLLWKWRKKPVNSSGSAHMLESWKDVLVPLTAAF